MYSSDQRIVMTLDAGRTKFVFSAIQANQPIVAPISYPTNPENLEQCLMTIVKGFKEVQAHLPSPAVALSFAFPGPAHYPLGIIGDVPNYPCFRGGVALGAFLEREFDLPVFINNDGDLFAYGEALAGALPSINARLKAAGSSKRYRNLVGVIIGTGFGAGVVVNKQLVTGDNSDGGNLWCNRNKRHQCKIVEDSVSIRGVQRVYRELSGDNGLHTHQDIYEIAEGLKTGDKASAIEAFRELGEVAGDAIAHASNLIDGIVVIGGQLSIAHKYIIDSIVNEMSCKTSTFEGHCLTRMTVKVVDLVNNFDELLKEQPCRIKIPMSQDYIEYNAQKLSGVYLSDIGKANAIAIGAYNFALEKIDSSI